MLPSDKKKKKSIFGKLKKLTKSRSIDDHVDSDVTDFRPIGTVSQVCLNRYSIINVFLVQYRNEMTKLLTKLLF